MTDQSAPAFRHPIRIALHDTDAAGVIFFGHLFRHLHDAYESWMHELGFPLEAILNEAAWTLPIVHAEAHYQAPMRHGQTLSVELRVQRIGERSATLAYHVVDPTGARYASGQTTHVCLDPTTGSACPLPEALRRTWLEALEAEADEGT
jgi:1,4-dihydroxy-2-naphthoyl-CoA hydrolase